MDSIDFEKIYAQIAKKHNVFVEEVKREMQAAIDGAWTSPRSEEVRSYQRQVKSTRPVPTIEECVLFVRDKILGIDD